MQRFVQLHLLVNYPPSNVNRDDTGRPKTALMGTATRLRISSQSQKRAWRTSEIFAHGLADNLGTRTRLMGVEIFDSLVRCGVERKKAREWARSIAECFGKLRTKAVTESTEKKAKAAKADKSEGDDAVAPEDLQIEQLTHFGPEEKEAIEALVAACAKRGSGPEKEELDLLRKPERAVDIAMFGRMLADKPAFNVEAAVQVAHAITVHRGAVEDDYFSAVDDLNKGLADKGAAHIGERGYGAGLFYVYLCINRELLEENLGGNRSLRNRALGALTQAATKVSPSGMKASFAHGGYALYVLAEKGDQQPRTLAHSFLTPIGAHDRLGIFDGAVQAITKRRENFDKVYGDCSDAQYELNVERGEGSLKELVSFVQE